MDQAHIDKWLEIEHFKEEAALLSESELHERFSELIAFGTGGMRAEMGLGLNRMNIYTVRLATTGLARQIIDNHLSKKVVISYDTRHQSKEFAQAAAQTLLHYGIKAYVFKEPRPTPMLSFALRYLQASAGIMITASHNPKIYNGYKLYGKDGGQLTPEAMRDVQGVMEENTQTILDLPISNDAPSLILNEIESAYLTELNILRQSDCNKDLSIVFTPLHGTGLIPIQKALNQFGYQKVFLEAAQSKLDGDFPTVAYPNPEEKSSFHLAEILGRRKQADILIATDPDADRLGVAIHHDGEYSYLSGNQLGALLLDYKLALLKETNRLPASGVAIKTIVTSELGRKIARAYGVDMEDTLTGFKYISEKIEAYHQTQTKTFLFGYEESYGYLLEDFARDKDAIQAAVAVCEMAEQYKQKNLTLIDALYALYEQHGYHQEKLISIELKSQSGTDEVSRLMQQFANPTPEMLADLNILSIENYLTSQATSPNGHQSPLQLPKEKVIKYQLEDSAWLCFRPSGTEAKMKIYLGVVADTDDLARTQLTTLRHKINQYI